MDEQFKVLNSKICDGVSALKELKYIVLQLQLCSVFHAIIESHLRYVDVIWRSLSKTKLDTLHAQKEECSSHWPSVECLIRFDCDGK